jgi:uncharacterized protein
MEPLRDSPLSTDAPRSRAGAIQSAVQRVVDVAGEHPVKTLGVAALALALTWSYGARLEARSDFLELLPRDSPSFIAFEKQLGRGGEAASLLVIAESPDPAVNRRFVDALADRLEGRMAERARCLRTCVGAGCPRCEPELIGRIERGTQEIRTYFERNKWLYASLADLESADRRLREAAFARSGLGLGLEDEEPGGERAPATSLKEVRRRIDEGGERLGVSPTGYFSVADGTAVGLRILGRSSGTGDWAGDLLMHDVEQDIAELRRDFPATLRVGLAGDIPNAVAEKRSLVANAVGATLLVLAVVFGGIVLFYRSLWSLVIISLPPLLGVGFAYAFAMLRYGYVNTAGAFLGAIILGNGINYPIVLFSRYQEFRAKGLAPPVARREAVWNAFRAELVGACVAAIAYGSLTVTRFRGFSQFGAIGFVGMLMAWVSMIPVVPAVLSVRERLQPRLPRWLRDRPARFGPEGVRSPLVRGLAQLTTGHARIIAAGALGLAVLAAVRLPGYLRDPWEYDFDKLGSRGSKRGGAGEWSNKAEVVFGGKSNVAGAQMLADSPAQAELVKAQILENDRKDPQGRLIEDVVTVQDLLPGSEAEQRRKLVLLARISARLTPRVLDRLRPEEREEARALVPPAELRVLHPEDLPTLLRRRFEERNGTLGTVLYVRYRHVSLSDGHVLLRIARTTGEVTLPDGTRVVTANRASVFAEMIRSLERDGPLATFASFVSVMVVVVLATRNVRGGLLVLTSLLFGVLLTVGGAAWMGHRLNFLNFIALPITFGIGCEYPFNVYDRSRLLGGDVRGALLRVGGAVALCSYTTVVGYGSLLIADLQALQSFGWLAVSGEIACLAGALLLLPAFLTLWRPAHDGS